MMIKKQKNNIYVFEFVDGSKFIIDGPPDIIYEFGGIVYKGFFSIIKNEIYIKGALKKVTIQ